MQSSCSKSCLCIESTDKCANYLLCNNIESHEILNSHDGLCVYCFIMNGKLNINENTTDQKCSFCLNVNKNIIDFSTKCDHHICIDCYKKKFIFELDDKFDEKNNIFNTCSICPK